MKSNITLISTKDMSHEEWLRFRFSGIGASEVSTIMGLNRFKSSIALFYEKLGEEIYTNDSLPAFLGKYREEFLSEMWEYWGGDQQSVINNFRNGTKIRRCKKVNAYAINEKYPWLFVSLDREINKHNGKENGTLELKEINGFEANKWEGGIPVGYILQVQTQMLVCEYPYGEIAILKDNTEFNVLPFDFNQTIADSIIERTKIFWDKVLQGRKIMTQRFEAQRNFNMKLVDELSAELQALEPEPDGSEAYNEFLKQKYRIATPGERIGTITELQDAKAHKEIKDKIKELEDAGRLYENRLKSVLRDGADKLDFGEDGYVSWKANEKGSRIFLNKIK